MKKYPDTPEEWGDSKNTLYRRFDLKSTPDIEVLIRLVQEHIPNKGNDVLLRARLLGILQSKHRDANYLFWTKREHPRTYKLRFWCRNLNRWFHRTFNTGHYRNQVELCNIASEIVRRKYK